MKKQEEELLNLLGNLNQANKSEIAFLIENPQFVKKPCFSFKEFVNNPYYLGLGEDV